MNDRRRQDSGANVVEAAFALPIFFFLLLGLIDFGLLALESNKASNAARDGARVGIIDYEEADVVGSADYNALKAAIERNLPGRTIPDPDLVVQCLTPAGGTISCADAVVDLDRLSVEVEWQRDSISPVTSALGFGSVDVSGESRMTIIGRPTSGSGTPPPACSPTSVNVSPNTVERFDSGPQTGQLTQDLVINFSASGSCATQSLHLVAPNGTDQVQICPGGCVGNTTYVGSSNSFWTAGTARAELRDGAGSVLLIANFTVTDPPPPCQVTDVTPSLATAQRTPGNQLSSNVGFTLTGASTCTTLTVTLNAPGGGSTVICSGTCSSATYIAGSSGIWTNPGFASISVTGQGTPYSESNLFEVINQPPCALDVTVEEDPADVASDGRLVRYVATGPDQRRQRVVVSLASGSGPCPSLVVTITPPSGSDTVTICPSGPCIGSHDYNGNDRIWAPTPTNDQAEVRVTGTGVSEIRTFTVQPA